MQYRKAQNTKESHIVSIAQAIKAPRSGIQQNLHGVFHTHCFYTGSRVVICVWSQGSQPDHYEHK